MNSTMRKSEERINKAFSGGKAFIPFVTCGDPDMETTERLVLAMARSGADIIELGIPFSDPVAEGPVIQMADMRALESGTTTDRLFEMVARIRKASSVPLVFMTYINPVFTYGKERFLERCSHVGIDGLIVPDMPFEEREELLAPCERYGVTLISMIAPTSERRIKAIASQARGFVYCVSSLGVTGMRTTLSDVAKDMVAAVKRERDIPCAIGFGISTPEQTAHMASFSDGVIVGSAIVRLVAQYGKDSVPIVAGFTERMKRAVTGTVE